MIQKLRANGIITAVCAAMLMIGAAAHAEIFSPPVFGAEPPAKQPEAKPADAKPEAKPTDAKPVAAAQELRATVTAVKGAVGVREAEDKPWQEAKVGMVLGQGADFRTGPRSSVTFKIPPEQIVTIDRLGAVKLLTAIKAAGAAGKVTTDLGMKYGRTQYKIETGGVEHETTVRSPGSTLAVRGSEVVHQHDAFASYAYGDGHLQFMNRLRRESIAFGNTGAKALVSTERLSGAGNARAAASVDSRGGFAGRTTLERTATEVQPGVGGEDYRELLNYRNGGFGDFAVGAFTPVNSPNTLFIDLSFFGGDANTLVNLTVLDPKGQALSLVNPATSDGRGTLEQFGPNQQVAFYGAFVDNKPLNFLNGKYTIHADLVSADAPGTPITLVLFLTQNIDHDFNPTPIQPDLTMPNIIAGQNGNRATTTVTVPK